jgi:anti-anti-sigma factor
MDDVSDCSVYVKKYNGMIVVTLAGEWDFYARDALHEALIASDSNSDVVVDARAANFFDSSALSELVTFFKRITSTGRRFELLVGNSNLERLLNMTGLKELLLPAPDRVAFLEEHVPVNGLDPQGRVNKFVSND